METYNKKQVALYTRSSTSYQQTGLQAQKRALEEFCKKNQIIDYLVFEDSGISGAKSSRPALNEMMGQIALGNISKVIVYSFSRFARSTRHLLEASAIFKKNGITFISVTEQVDTSSPIGTAFFTILAALAELERELIVERVKNGIANARSRGKQIGRLRTRNDELIHSLRKAGHTYKGIARLAGVSEGTVAKSLKSYLKPDYEETGSLPK